MPRIVDERTLIFKKVHGEFEQLLCVLEGLLEQGKRLDEVERDVMNMLLKIGKASLEDFVEAAGDGDVGETVENDGIISQTDARKTHSHLSFCFLVS